MAIIIKHLYNLENHAKIKIFMIFVQLKHLEKQVSQALRFKLDEL